LMTITEFIRKSEEHLLLNDTSPLDIGILYLGGTIGCAGSPLQPLSAEVFLPRLAAILDTELATTLHPATALNPHHTQIEWHYFSGQIKDSSALVPDDWREILELLLNPQYGHIQHWIILHGTDTLAFTAAFLAAALQATQLKVIVTGSQFPLLDSTQQTFDPNSDALDNIKTSFAALCRGTSNSGWVRVAFNQTDWIADGVQKIHTRNRIAFAGQSIESKLIHPEQKNHQIDTLLNDPQRFRDAISALNIQIYYVLPLPLDTLVLQLEQTLMSGASTVILLAYGLGNLLDDLRIHRALLAADQRGVMVILSTQVPFGGVEPRYAAGNWLAACGVLSGGSLPVSTLFARLAWLQITTQSVSERRQQWLEYLASVSHSHDEENDEQHEAL
jgi:L-asparaginase